MSRRARTHSSFFAVVLVLVGFALWFATRNSARASDTAVSTSGTNSGTNTGSSTPPLVVHPLPGNFPVKLIRAGLDAKTLCAAGVASGSILATLQAGADQMNGAPTSLDAADATYAAARVAADALERKIRSGQASQQEIAQYQTAKATLANATSERQALLDGYFTAATSGLSQAQRAALTKIRANRSWGLPAEYLVVDHTEADWVKLRDAISSEKIALDLPDTASESVTSYLATIRADGSVFASITSNTQNLAAVTSAWNTAAGAN